MADPPHPWNALVQSERCRLLTVTMLAMIFWLHDAKEGTIQDGDAAAVAPANSWHTAPGAAASLRTACSSRSLRTWSRSSSAQADLGGGKSLTQGGAAKVRPNNDFKART